MIEQLQQLITLFFQLICVLLNPFVLIPALIVIIPRIKKNKEYKRGAYFQITKLPYGSVKRDKGRYGEYLIYKYLKNFEKSGAKFLFNAYIPKENGETSEIDALMICSKGIFVFESKNYSGWIFGDERQKYWYQTLPSGRGQSHKEQFYNPIMQNRSHIKHLKSLIGDKFPIWSIIAFSDRCILKNIQITSNDIYIINRYNVATTISSICDQCLSDSLSTNDVLTLYSKLYAYTQADTNTKAQHIANIHRKSGPYSVIKTEVCFSEKSDSSSAEIPMISSLDGNNEKSQFEPIVAQTPTDSQETFDLNTSNQQMNKCPKCGGTLVLRTATRGSNAGNQFYGCSNYPKCKYIQNITNKPE